jgi:hypothetical protein
MTEEHVSSPDESGERTEKSSSREELEREKLTLEIEEMKRPWWRRPSYILAALPTVLAVLALVYGLSNGYFQASAVKLANERRDLEIAKAALQKDVAQLSRIKGELETSNRKLQEALKQVNDEVQRSRATVAEVQYLRYRLYEAEEKLKRLVPTK